MDQWKMNYSVSEVFYNGASKGYVGVSPNIAGFNSNNFTLFAETDGSSQFEGKAVIDELSI